MLKILQNINQTFDYTLNWMFYARFTPWRDKETFQKLRIPFNVLCISLLNNLSNTVFSKVLSSSFKFRLKFKNAVP